MPPDIHQPGEKGEFAARDRLIGRQVLQQTSVGGCFVVGEKWHRAGLTFVAHDECQPPTIRPGETLMRSRWLESFTAMGAMSRYNALWTSFVCSADHFMPLGEIR